MNQSLKTVGLGLVIAAAALFGAVLWDASVLHQALGSGLDETTVVLGAMTLSMALTTIGYVLRRAGDIVAPQTEPGRL